MSRAPTDVERGAYHRDGVVLLRGAFDASWIELLTRGLDAQMAAPTARARTWDRDADGRTMFWDSQAWLGIEEYQRFVFESPAAEIAGEIMGSPEINFVFDAVFVRSPGAQFSTPWHQDEPYWSIDGYDSCTIWMPLVPVSAANALAFVPGSHVSTPIWNQYNFGELNPDDHKEVDQVDFSEIARQEVPDTIAIRSGWSAGRWSPAIVLSSTGERCTVALESSTRTSTCGSSPRSGWATTSASSFASVGWIRTTAR